MEQKLPKIFANKISKDLNNNKKTYYSFREKEKNIVNDQSESKPSDDKNVYQKINDIFNSERYVYKADVNIKTRDGYIKTKIIGKNHTHLITFENKLIPIGDIEDIEFAN